MNKRDREKYSAQLRKMANRIQGTAESAEEQARTATGGDAAGGLSSTPIHLGDIGSEAYAQELGATLLANEQFLLSEILAALDRIEKGTFGRCENCGRAISHERLEALPYARYCITCSAKLQAAPAVNLNEGRPKNWVEGIGLRAEGPPPGAPGGPEEDEEGTDHHAAGTPGGGTALGGLAGTTVGTGDPEDEEEELEEAMGASNLDALIEASKPEEEKEGYAGRAGGAVGGVPANKRAVGGKDPPK
jgi:RNA polymerase-binding transcription factor DksA